MTRFRMPRYEGTDPNTVDALHDAAMDDLVQLYVALRNVGGSQIDPEPSERPAEGNGTPK